MKNGTRQPADPVNSRGGRRAIPRPTVLIAVLLLACAVSIAGCGGSSKNGLGGKAESVAETPVGGEEAAEVAAAKKRAAQLKKSEEIENAEVKKKIEALRKAQAQSTPTAPKKHSGAKRHPTGLNKQRTAKSKKAKHSKPSGGSPAEEAARKQFAKEEAQEQAAFKKQERQEAAGR